LVIALIFLSLIAYVLFNGSSTEGIWLSKLQMPKFELNIFENLDLQFSKTLTYGAVFLAVMITVQMTVLKSFFEKKMSY
jgi:hypothetical protein